MKKKWLDDIPKNSNCLNEEQTISKDFLESRYADINEIYQKNQIETSIFNTTYLQRELYKILGIAYEKLYYVKEEILIYKNNESTDFEFVISGDVGEKYLNSFYRQVRDVVYPGMENFFERDRKFAETHYNASIVTLEEKEIKQKLLKDLSESEVVLDEHVEKYEQTREIIDNTEIDTMIHYNTEIDYQALIVSCNRMRKLLNTSIAASINQISKKKIWLLYNNEEYEINNFLDSLFAIKKKKGEIFFLERQDSETEFICFYPNILIEFVEKTENVFGRPLTVVEGRVKFDSIVIKEKIDKIISDKNPFFSINKPEKSDRTCIENGVVLTYGYRNTKQKRYTNKTKGRKH